MICPMDKCGKELKDNEIQLYCKKETYDKLLEFRKNLEV